MRKKESTREPTANSLKGLLKEKQEEKRHEENINVQIKQIEIQQEQLKRQQDQTDAALRLQEKSVNQQKIQNWFTLTIVIITLLMFFINYCALKTAQNTFLNEITPKPLIEVSTEIPVISNKEYYYMVQKGKLNTTNIPFYYSISNVGKVHFKLNKVLFDSPCFGDDTIIPFVGIQSITLSSGESSNYSNYIGAGYFQNASTEEPCIITFTTYINGGSYENRITVFEKD